MIQRIDAWIIDRVAQPAVNAAWSRLGVGRKAMCRCVAAVWACARVADLDGAVDAILLAITVPLILWDIETSPHQPTHVGAAVRVLLLALTAFGLLSAYLIPNAGQVAFLSAIYLCVCKDPPRGKRKDWRETAHKFASQWTWLPAGGKA